MLKYYLWTFRFVVINEGYVATEAEKTHNLQLVNNTVLVFQVVGLPN